MQDLHTLIHELSREEKRLYQLRKSTARFNHIYQAYVSNDVWSRELDRQVYAGHYAEVSRAFYSMQKMDLLEDILSVLQDHARHDDPLHQRIRLRARAELLMNRGFHSLAHRYLEKVIDATQEKDPAVLAAWWEEYARCLRHSPDASLKRYDMAMLQAKSFRALAAETEQQQGAAWRLAVAFREAEQEPDQARYLKEEIRKTMTADADNMSAEARFRFQERFSRLYESPKEWHAHLIQFEKTLTREIAGDALRNQILFRILESCLDNGDFLHMNSVMYKIEREVKFSTAYTENLLPDYFSLFGIYYFYENDLPRAIQQFNFIFTAYREHPEVLRQELYLQKASVSLAGSLPRQAREAMDMMYARFPETRNNLYHQVLDCVIWRELNERENLSDAAERLRTAIRHSEKPRKYAWMKDFVGALIRISPRKRIVLPELNSGEEDWRMLFKPNRWLRAKAENQFYYNFIIDYWTERKRVIRTV